MPELWESLTAGFMPHGYCLQWNKPLLAVFITGNVGIAIAYFLIPAALRHFVGKRKDLPYPHMFKLFAAFILSCGITHLVKIWTLYQPVYWIEAYIDLFTAAVSLLTAFLLFPLIPKALKLRSAAELEAANEKLSKMKEELELAKNNLAIQVQERTVQLVNTTQKGQEDRALFEQLFDMMPQLGWTANALGYVELYNKGWYTYTGTTLEEMRDRSWEALTDSDMLPIVKKAWTESMNSGVPFEMKFPLKDADGKFEWFLTRVNPIMDSDGKVVRWVGINTNIQDEVNQSQNLERIVKERTAELETAKIIAEQALETKGRFLATVSHEVRTPLAGIIGLTEILTYNDFGSDINSTIQAILDSSKRLLRLLNDLLEASRIDSGKIQIRNQDFPIRSVIDDITQLIKVEADKKKLQIIATCDEKVPDFVVGDELRVRQILLNLAFNAVKFTEHGSIEISAKLRQKKDDKIKVFFSVTDTGIGLTEEQQSKLFNPFEQADQSIHRTHGGAGLGLSISKSLVELMGGEIGVSSECGQGSTFWIEIPFAEQTLHIDE